jgi:uncharacterized membrane protein
MTTAPERIRYEKVGRLPSREDDDFEEDEENPSSANASVSTASEKDRLVSSSSAASVSGAAPTARERIADAMSSGGFLRLTILVAVMLQNTGYALVRRYSRGDLKEKYSTSSALLTMEVAKLIFSAIQVATSGAASDVPSGSAFSKYIFLISHSWKMLVPAVIYLIMNILGFLALGHLDASTFSIVAQMKVCFSPTPARPKLSQAHPATAHCNVQAGTASEGMMQGLIFFVFIVQVFTTAIFSVLILQRHLPMRKWRALTTLTLGVILISNEAIPKHDKAQANSIQHERKLREFAIGMAASFGDVLLSGFASIYFEMVRGLANALVSSAVTAVTTHSPILRHCAILPDHTIP